jgi:hypothetical protein
MVELLLARGENKVRSAVDTLQHPILKFRHTATLNQEAKRVPRASPDKGLLDLAAALLAIALTRERLLHPFLFPRFQIKRMPLDLFNNVFLLHLSLKPAESVLKSLALLEPHFSQTETPPTPSKIYHCH